MTARALPIRAAIVAAVIVLGGCSSGGGPPSPVSGRATVPPSVPTTTTAGAQPSGTATAPVGPARRRTYVFPVRTCHVSYGHAHHDYPATDIFAAEGCAFVAPVSGVVTEVTTRDRWDASSNRGRDRGGLSVAMTGADGVRYYGSHLSAVSAGIRPGTTVRAGQVLGRVGSTGDAAGIASHLHFGISWPTRPGVWWVRRGEVPPWPYLDAWRRGVPRSPARAVVRARAAAGTPVPRCAADC